MKTLVVFYSYEGNTRLAAGIVAEAAGGADMLELRPVRDMKSKGFMKYVWGGRAAVMGVTPVLQDFDADFDQYDLIFIGTPVWAFTYTPALKTFFKGKYLKGKKIALFCCHEGVLGRTIANMKKALKGNSIAGEFAIFAPAFAKDQSKLKKLSDWAVSFIK